MLAGVGETLPNPHLLIRPFLKREAVLSSKIEGTVASVSDLMLFEASGGRRDPGDAHEVYNYVQAIEHGLAKLHQLPLCSRLLNEVHAVLLRGVRGGDKRPGELRKIQNWIGHSPTTPIQDARYIPPPHNRVADLLTHWEHFVNDDEMRMPPLIQCALMHYQFEAIHPYVDGNGRIGRLAIVLFLCSKGVLPIPLLYLSDYFERHDQEYYDHLYNVSRTGQWDEWLEFFLKGVEEQSRDALMRSRRVRALQETYRAKLIERRASAKTMQLVEKLFENPYVSAPRAVDLLDVTHAGAQGIIQRLQKAEILEPLPGLWPRLFVARELLEMIEAPVSAS